MYGHIWNTYLCHQTLAQVPEPAGAQEMLQLLVCVCVCVCVCERERERETHTHTHTAARAPGAYQPCLR